MALSIVSGSASLFDSIRHVDEHGNEYWLARELMPLLVSKQWRRFENAIERAIVACENSGQQPIQHFAGAGKTSQMPNGGVRSVSDFRLSRYGAYLAAMNGDPRKSEIAAAQSYKANEIGKYHPALKPAMEQAKKLLPAPVPDRLLTVTNLAKLYHEQTGKHLANGKDATEAKAMNLPLEKIGLQYRNQDSGEPRWLPTELGKQYASVVLQEALNNNKTVQQLRWQPAVLDTLR